MKRVHGEIEYVKSDGTKIHSDICPKDCNSDNMNDSEYRKFLHECLDEWLDCSNGTCAFYIKNEKYKIP